MIAIKYSGRSLPKYDALCANLQKKIDTWIRLGYVGDKSSHVDMEADAREFFKLLNYPNAISKIANLSASRLTWLIDLLEHKFTKLKDDRVAKEVSPKAKVSNLYKCIEKAFSNYGYDSSTFPSEELMSDLNLTVCPYCNRNFIKNIKVRQNANGKDIYVKGQLDHFYPRSLYPYLAICRHNLVPSCPTCNGASGKHFDNTRAKGVVNPYLLTDCNGMKFKMEITGKGFTNLKTCAKAISIDIDCTANPALANNEDIFHLKKIYSTHTDYAAEIYYKSILSKPYPYLQYIEKMMKDKRLKYSRKDLERILLGVYTEEKDFKKRPLSKFCTDLANQRKLIP